jgi:hypothetical protein
MDELASLIHQDNLLHGPQYGPGNEQSKSVAKKLGAVALATTYFTPLGAVTGPLTVAIGGAGGATYLVGEIANDDSLKEVGGFFFGTALDAGAEGLAAVTMNPGAPALAKGIKTLAQGYNVASDIMDPIGKITTGPRERAQVAGYIASNLF